MTHTRTHRRWIAVVIFFAFMLLHQTDRLLIGPFTSAIMSDFQINEVQMGGVVTGALVIGSVFYPIWGYLYDRFHRPLLLSIASLVWGLTTWTSSLVKTASSFMVARASTGIDDSSIPGIASLVSDYFAPKRRGRIFGLLQVSIPLGYLLGMVVSLKIGTQIGWRQVYLITGSLGVLLSGVIYLGVKEVPRGQSEPELAHLSSYKKETFKFSLIPDLVQKRSLLLIFCQGFLGVIPWQVITFWSFRYLEVERSYSAERIFSIMTPAVLMIAAGYFLGGYLGDLAYNYYPRGRMYVSILGVLCGALLLFLTLSIPNDMPLLFLISLSITALFIPFASPNIASTVYDIVLPEIRSTAISIQYFLGNIGSAFAPLLAGYIAHNFSLHQAILGISVVTWLITAAIMSLSAYFLPRDMEALHQELSARALNK
jgi:MFS family permease